jgi:hypothetical protein
LVVAVDHGFRELFILKDCKIGFFGRKKFRPAFSRITCILFYNRHFDFITCIFAHDLHFWRSQNADRHEKNGFLTNFSRYEIFRSVYINAYAFDIFWLLVGRFDEVRALPQPAFRVLPGISVSFQRRIKKMVRFQFVFAANNRKISMLNKNQDQAIFMYFLKLNKI